MKAIKFLNLLLIFTFLLGCSKDEVIDEQPQNSAKQITSFQFLLSDNPFDANVIATIDEDSKTISFNVPDGAEITTLLPSIEVSPNATYLPQGAQNFREPVVYNITAEDGTSEIYTVKAVLSQRHILMAIFNANPNNNLDWILSETDISNWTGVTTNTNGEITELNLYNKGLTTLPYEIGSLTNLTYLNLPDNQLTSLPVQIGNLTNLTKLNMYLNYLTEIPPEIGNLNDLSKLTIYDNQLTSLPPEIGNLTNLTELHLRDNQLTSLPIEIGNLTNLTQLTLGNNQLTSLVIQIGQLINLTKLYVQNNQLTSLPTQIGNLTNLIQMYLPDNQLTSLPNQMGSLTNLTLLNIQNNNITMIPTAVCNLNIPNLSSDPGVICP